MAANKTTRQDEEAALSTELQHCLDFIYETFKY
jgi:hypothetical protein